MPVVHARAAVWCGLMSIAGVALAATLIAVATAGASTPRCFGAASRDPQRACKNPRLRLMVRPTPDEALITPNLACVGEQITAVIDGCSYGKSAKRAVESVAMIGDSHAAHWRAAMKVVALRKRWRVLEIARPHCPFTYASQGGGGPLAATCLDWNHEVIGWLGEHPEVRIVFTTANAQAPVVAAAGKSEWETRRDGFLDAWNALPPSVQQLVVIRDNPTDRVRTQECIRHAMAAHRPPAQVCVVPRRLSLPPDAAVSAARRLRTRGATTVNLTHYFCGRRRCLPVVGGVLVHKDVDHLTQVFARTLGPYLLRAINATTTGAP